ncbi:hypothetical protein IFM89_009767 [Coptis chinensis]|uniref:Cullin N-terminal domain-containing protein n=1 Tax=Coptis chinensis TaxID=261450 RepID=A0A835HZ75_9MAGN|nr:hypothetical protein IFM89_009767 [Coptis chinensis]
MYIQDSFRNGTHHDNPLSYSQSIRDVNYSCGSCGYALNLSSSNRNTSTISSKYGKSMKRGIISFFSIDENRFTQVDELQCIPYYVSKNSWGFFRRRTKLLCRKCGNLVGTTYEDNTSLDCVGSDVSDSTVGNTRSTRRKYDVKIRALQPSSDESVASLADTSANYDGKGTKWIEEDSCPEYMLKIQMCLRQQKDRVSHYLHSSSGKNMLYRVQDGVLQGNISPGLDSFSSSVPKQHNTDEGIALVKQEEDACHPASNKTAEKNNVVEVVLIQNIRKLHDKYLEDAI